MKNSYSRQGQQSKSANAREAIKPAVFAFLLAWIGASVPLHAATAPPATLLFTAPGPIQGGVATIGSSGVTYFCTLSAGQTPSTVFALNLNGTVKWSNPVAPGTGSEANMFAVPALDAAGAKLYIGSDAGLFYCLNTSDGTINWTFTVPGTGDRKIRSGAALDPNNPLGSTVYFQCNDGFLYARDANTGARRWEAPTGNEGGPPVGFLHDNPLSSSPVVAADGSVYVASANGHVFRFNPSTGAQLMDMDVGLSSRSIEASLAIGNNGWIYGATRSSAAGSDEKAFAINPVTPTIVWQKPVDTTDGSLGVIVAPVIDQSGFVYVADFGHTLMQFDGTTGFSPREWTGNNLIQGKLCQTPTLLQNGFLLLGESFVGANQDNSELAAFKIYGESGGAPVWTSTGTTAAPMGATLFGAVAVRCTSTWYIFIADTSGQVYRLSGTDPMMAGQWPTLQCGNRRAGKTITYPTAIAELPPFYFGDPTFTYVSRVDFFGRVVGGSIGYYDTSCGGGAMGSAAALWRNNGISLPGGCPGSNMAYTFATALNGFGDVCGYGYGPVPLAWQDGANSNTPFTTLSTRDFTMGSASDINEKSTIIGYCTSGNAVHTFRWEKFNNTWTNLTTFDLGAPIMGDPTNELAYAYAITDDGRIAGKARFTSGGPFHAFNTGTFPGDLMSGAVDLGTMGGTASEALDMHELSGTVGRSQILSGYWRAFYLPINCTTLGTNTTYQIPALPGFTRTDYSSAAYGVNKFGLTVGSTQKEDANHNLISVAFIYSPDFGGSISDLNTITLDGGQTPAGLGWKLTKAQAINDAGVIVGYGTLNGRTTAWILYPKCQD